MFMYVSGWWQQRWEEAHGGRDESSNWGDRATYNWEPHEDSSRERGMNTYNKSNSNKFKCFQLNSNDFN